MALSTTEISIKGKPVSFPSFETNGRTIIAIGGWLKVASIQDEEWLFGEAVREPGEVIADIRREGLEADIFTFASRLLESAPRFPYPYVWENVAAISTSDYNEWWEKRLPQETRKNVRRSLKRGVVVRTVDFDDAFLRGVVAINNETPVRQGRPFWHYGKSFEEVKKDYSTMLDHSMHIAAFCGDEMIGFIKLVDLGKIASILQILCMNKHQDKRPANALIAKAVQVCIEKNKTYLQYGQYVYGKNTDSPLTEFKRRNGFEKILVPRYYVPITFKGKLAVALRMYKSIKRFIPKWLYSLLYSLRARWYNKANDRTNEGKNTQD